MLHGTLFVRYSEWVSYWICEFLFVWMSGSEKYRLKSVYVTICFRWYAKLSATIKWQGNNSSAFRITKGTRQGSILSPYFFNIFINNLLVDLQRKHCGVSIGNLRLNCFAYADDVNLFSTSAVGLQTLIDTCHTYSQRWRFKFGITKTKCMIVGKNILSNVPQWKLGTHEISNVKQLEILGTVFSDDGTSKNHVDTRIRKCRQAFYGLNNSGMAYPGATTDVKCYLWNTICKPVLSYGLESINLNGINIRRLETTQGNLVKQCLGLSKRSHSTQLLSSLNIHRIEDLVNRNTLSLFCRIFKVDTPLRSLITQMVSLYICKGIIIPGSLVSRILSMGKSPMYYMFNDFKSTLPDFACNGHIDSIRNLIYHENFIKPYSNEHCLVALLTKSF